MASKTKVNNDKSAEALGEVIPEVLKDETLDDDGQISRYPLPASMFSQIMSLHPLSGSLPLDFRASRKGGELVPAIVFAPPHLRNVDRLSTPFPAAIIAEPASDTTVVGSSPLVVTDYSALTTTEKGLTEEEFLNHADAMLSNNNSQEVQPQFKASAADPFYDFDEYIFLRDPDDPYAFDTDSPQPIPSDPRFQRFVDAAAKGIHYFIIQALFIYGRPPTPIRNILESSLRQELVSWWLKICAIRAFNRFGRYSRADIFTFLSKSGYKTISPEEFYGQALGSWLALESTGVLQEARGYIAGGGNTKALVKLLTVAFWENVLVYVFKEYFDDNDIRIVDPSAPEKEYPFDPFPADEILFGLQVVYRQTWHHLGYARGELVRSIPLGPKESQKVSMKVTRRKKTTRIAEESTSSETSSEATSTNKDTSDVVQEASEKLNMHAEAEVSGGVGGVFSAKVSGGIAQDTSSSSKQTKSRLNEQMEKTASRMKKDTKITINTEGEESFEETRSSELINANDEVGVTYLYHRLQQQFWVSTEIAEVNSVIYVPEPLPAWKDIDEDWVRQHGEIIAAALLDGSYAPILAAIRREPDNLAYESTNVFDNAATAGTKAATDYAGLNDGGSMPDLLSSGQQFFERDFERRNTLLMDQKRRKLQSKALITHIQRNILYYMRAIWTSEDYDQRMQRLSRMRVATEWVFVPNTPLPSGTGAASPLEVEGMFIPLSTSTRPLTQVIHPIGPIGFLFNCAIYRLRDDPKLVNLHQALAYLRANYTRFRVTIQISKNAGVTLRDVVAVAPRSFSTQYTFTYMDQPNKNRWESGGQEVRALPDGSLEAFGLRIWLDGKPVDQATLTIRVRMSGELEDPHFRLVQILHPLPAANEENEVFTEDLLREMITVLPELGVGLGSSLDWNNFTPVQQSQFRNSYHRFLMLQESGRLVSLDTANLLLDLKISHSPALEPFKRLHRYIDVLKEYQELRRRAMDNSRREELIKKGFYGDPDVERVTLVGARDDIKDVVALPDGPSD